MGAEVSPNRNFRGGVVVSEELLLIEDEGNVPNVNPGLPGASGGADTVSMELCDTAELSPVGGVEELLKD